MTNFDNFVKIYTEELAVAIRDYPDEYRWPIENFPRVVERMTESFKNKSYGNQGRAIKATCKKLKISQTYKAINAYLDG